MVDICILIPSFATGGAEKVGVNLANFFAKSGWRVDLVSLSDSGHYKKNINIDVNIITINKSRARYSLFSLRKYLRNREPARILSVLRRTNIFISLASIGLRVKPALYFREASLLRDMELEPFLQRKFTSFLMKQTYSSATKIIANSPLTRDDLISYNVIASKKCIVIPNPVLPDNFQDLLNEPVHHRWFNKKFRVILNVARLHEVKRQAFLIESFKYVLKEYPDARLLIVGEGAEKAKLKKLIKELGLEDEVELHDFVENPFPYYKKSAVFVLTSFWEGFGNVVVEALAAGLPVVASANSGGPAYILNSPELGRLYVNDSPFEVAKSITQMLVEKNSEVNRIKKAQQYCIGTVAELYAEAMELN